jgi:hypothetical protein
MENKLDNYKNELLKNGYTIIPNVYSKEEIDEYKNLFYKWYNNIENLKILHDTIDFNGIFKHHQVGHQRFAWLARTNNKIINIFKYLWNTDKLVSSFDGCCYYPSNYKNDPSYWIHTDQSSLKLGLWCYQSFLSLTDNVERTFVVYESTHIIHQKYFNDMDIHENTDWNIIDKDYCDTLSDKKKTLKVDAGSLVIWDSRTFHQNTCGPINCNEERLVQYLCYLPKDDIKNNEQQQNKRKKFYEKLRTTSHWPYPINPVPLQPNFYNYYNTDNPIIIDYDNLPKPELHDLQLKINELI